MTRVWKISPADRKIIRDYAAKAARKRPGQIALEVGERYRIGAAQGTTSMNIKIVDPTPDWDESDLSQTWRFSEVREIELTPEGEAEVDFYVYTVEGFGASRDHGDLETNVQAHVKLVGGKPRLWKMTDTDWQDTLVV